MRLLDKDYVIEILDLNHPNVKGWLGKKHVFQHDIKDAMKFKSLEYANNLAESLNKIIPNMQYTAKELQHD